MNSSDSVLDAPGPSEKGRSANFLQDTLKLVSGTVIAQILSVLISPIITRLYSPDAIGISALFTAITGLIIIVSCMRYEFAIMLPKSNKEAANILAISLFSAVLISFLTVPVIWVYKAHISLFLKAPGLEEYLWLVPPMVLVSGIFQALNYWTSRMRHFESLSAAKVGSSIVLAGTQLTAGFTGYPTGGYLIIASLLGSAASMLVLGIKVLKDDCAFFRRSISLNCIVSALRRYHRFPVYDTGAALLNSISSQSPMFILSAFFSSSVVGYYALGMNLLQMPVILVAGAVSQVFFQRASDAKNSGNLGPVVESVFANLVLIGSYPFLLLSLIGGDLFSVVFGAKWVEAGLYVQILSLWILFVFITSPMSIIFSVLERQNIFLKINIALLIIRIGSLALGGMLGNALISLSAFSIMGVLAWMCICYWILNTSGASLSRILSSLRLPFAFSLPSLIAVASIKLAFDPKPEIILIISSFSCVIYYLICLKYRRHLFFAQY